MMQYHIYIYSTYVSEDCDSGDKPLSQSKFLQLFGLINVSNSIVWQWMRHLGFTYDKWRNSYFSDKHENKENVNARQKFIKKYFNYEKRAYRWVQVPIDLEIEMENDTEQPLAKNISYEYKYEKKEKCVSIILMLTLYFKLTL